jgi:Putative MetA-pathway of phenol degradation
MTKVVDPQGIQTSSFGYSSPGPFQINPWRPVTRAGYDVRIALDPWHPWFYCYDADHVHGRVEPILFCACYVGARVAARGPYRDSDLVRWHKAAVGQRAMTRSRSPTIPPRRSSAMPFLFSFGALCCCICGCVISFRGLSNLGIGHGAIDAGGGYTYFDQQTGHEFSAVLGFTYNLKNQSTQYQNGIDMHLDWGASQFLTEQPEEAIVAGTKTADVAGVLGKR